MLTARARLDLEPIGQPRPRARVISLGGGRTTAQVYNPKGGEHAEWKRSAVVLLRAAYHGPPIVGPSRLQVLAVFSLPKGEHRKRSVTPRRWHTATPDFDNVLKIVTDAAVEAGWMPDDRQVCEVSFQKVCGAQGETPAVHVTLTELPPL